MSDENQFVIPPSFIALFVEPGRIKPSASREAIAERYELCEDLATVLTERARTMQWELGVAEDDVLERIRRGLETALLIHIGGVFLYRRGACEDDVGFARELCHHHTVHDE